jgi:hypothetical protein
MNSAILVLLSAAALSLSLVWPATAVQRSEGVAEPPSSYTPCGASDTWQEVDAPPGTIFINGQRFGLRSVAVGTAGSPAVYVAGNQGAFRGQGCEWSWMDLLGTPNGVSSPFNRSVVAITIDGSQTIYTAGLDADPILTSSDAGQNWVRGISHSTGLRPTLLARASRLSASLTQPGVAYAVLENPDLRGHTGLAKTEDAGQNWQVRDPRFMGSVAVDPSDSETLYASTGRCSLCRSIDGGRTFQGLPIPSDWHSEPRALSFQPGGNRLWLSTSDAFYVSKDRAVSWQLLAGPQVPEPIVSIAGELHEDGRLFVITEGGRLWARRVGAD